MCQSLALVRPDVLKGKKVLVTRPEGLAANLCARIEACGGVALRLPVTRIAPPEDISAARRLLAGLDRYHVGIFVSRNAVQWTLDLLNSRSEVLRRLVLVAVGPATAAQLRRSGFEEVHYAGGKAGSEALLELPVLQEAVVRDKNIIIFRGEGGRELLASTLRKRGARVEYAEVYRRTSPRSDAETLDRLWSETAPDVIVITSTQGLQNLYDLTEAQHRQRLLSTTLVVIGERMVSLTRRLGFDKPPILAPEASDEGILKTLVDTVDNGDL